ADNHDYQFKLKAGTSGVSAKAKVNDDIDFDANVSGQTIKALKDTKEFKEKVELAGSEIVSNVKGIKSKIENIGAEKDTTVDKSQHEQENLPTLEKVHLKANYSKVLKSINKLDGTTKEGRNEIVKKAGFDGYKVLDPNKLPKKLKERNEELEKQGLEPVRTFVGKDKDGNKILYTVGDVNVDNFKSDTAREYGINKNGRKVKDIVTGEEKLLGATIGDIYSDYVEKTGNEEKIHLEADEVNDGDIVEIVSDTISDSGIGIDVKITNASGVVIGTGLDARVAVDHYGEFIGYMEGNVNLGVGENNYIIIEGNTKVELFTESVNDIESFSVDLYADISFLNKMKKSLPIGAKIVLGEDLYSKTIFEKGKKTSIGSVGVEVSQKYIFYKGSINNIPKKLKFMEDFIKQGYEEAKELNKKYKDNIIKYNKYKKNRMESKRFNIYPYEVFFNIK
ncbi:MAG: hypothetical protein KGV54_00685, partial [Oceanivirga sp.]|nr:hypothetical protein [Oceanivirga sp.]